MLGILFRLLKKKVSITMMTQFLRLALLSVVVVVTVYLLIYPFCVLHVLLTVFLHDYEKLGFTQYFNIRIIYLRG